VVAKRLQRATLREQRQWYAQVQDTFGKEEADHRILHVTIVQIRNEKEGKKEAPWWQTWLQGLVATILVTIVGILVTRYFAYKSVDLRVTKIEATPLVAAAPPHGEIGVAEEVSLDIVIDGSIVRSYERERRNAITAGAPIELPAEESYNMELVLVSSLSGTPSARLRYQGRSQQVQPRGGGSIQLDLVDPGRVPGLMQDRAYKATVYYTLYGDTGD
jgi:hypothetical protein